MHDTLMERARSQQVVKNIKPSDVSFRGESVFEKKEVILYLINHLIYLRDK